MRLLNVMTLELEEFYGEHGIDIPDYAILSHTWGKDEVLFSDLKDPACKPKEGWKKVMLTCKEAISQNFGYVWIDTCCIDKSSSSELSEAINSMFLWYKKAAVCYAYLVDVNKNDPAFGTFSTSRWFSRGWTLQELLAPINVVFYDSNWEKLGTRSSLSTVISMATGIKERVLNDPDHGIGISSIACKMSWASKRNTTRVEDAAYCLMGIFDVHMPLLYGEGDRAFTRLQEEILKVSNDHSIFAWGFQTLLWDFSFGQGVFFQGLGESSALAPNPKLFAESGGISENKTVMWESHSITNVGLQITLPIIHRFDSSTGASIESVALLNCRLDDVDHRNHCIGIVLAKNGSGNLYSRKGFNGSIDSKHYWRTVLVKVEDSFQAEPEKMFIRQHQRNEVSHLINPSTSDRIFHVNLFLINTEDSASNFLGQPLIILPRHTRNNRGVVELPLNTEPLVIVHFVRPQQQSDIEDERFMIVTKCQKLDMASSNLDVVEIPQPTETDWVDRLEDIVQNARSNFILALLQPSTKNWSSEPLESIPGKFVSVTKRGRNVYGHSAIELIWRLESVKD